MPLPADHPTTAPASLSSNARTVLEKRYLVKDKTGQAGRDAGRHVLARGHGGGGGRPAIRRDATSSSSALAADVLRADDAAPVRAELAHADERRPSARPAVRVLRASRRRCAQQRACRHLRHAALDGAHPPERRRHRVLVLAPALEGVDGALDHGRGERPRELHEALRCQHRRGEAGRHASRREHGNPARRSSGHPGVHRLQGRPHADRELQHLRGRHRHVHAGARGRRPVRPRRSGQQESHGPAPREGRLGQDAPRRVAHGRAGRVLHRRGEPLQPGAAPRRVRGDQPVRRAAAAARTTCATSARSTSATTCATARSTGMRSRRTSICPRTSSTTSSTSTSIRCRRSTRSPSAFAASALA